jgi:hypothetical protein
MKNVATSNALVVVQRGEIEGLAQSSACSESAERAANHSTDPATDGNCEQPHCGARLRASQSPRRGTSASKGPSSAA